jgi:hypothetical protein
MIGSRTALVALTAIVLLVPGVTLAQSQTPSSNPAFARYRFFNARNGLRRLGLTRSQRPVAPRATTPRPPTSRELARQNESSAARLIASDNVFDAIPAGQSLMSAARMHELDGDVAGAERLYEVATRVLVRNGNPYISDGPQRRLNQLRGRPRGQGGHPNLFTETVHEFTTIAHDLEAQLPQAIAEGHLAHAGSLYRSIGHLYSAAGDHAAAASAYRSSAEQYRQVYNARDPVVSEARGWSRRESTLAGRAETVASN